MAKEKILIVEDEQGIRELMQLYLENRKYSVITAENGEQALSMASAHKPDLILLDIEMPGLSGFDVCRKIRERMTIPILFISCRTEVLDKVKCFELGGDDYLTKPFDFDELLARMKANLRRFEQYERRQDVSEKVLKYDGLEIHLDTCQCYIQGEQCILSAKEMQLLIMMAKHPNQVLSVEQLYEQIWGYDSGADLQTVKVHISRLRRKLERKPKADYIQTVRGFGYLFAG